MRERITKGLVLMMITVLLLGFVGCRTKSRNNSVMVEDVIATLPEQEEMSQEALASAMETAEYQMVVAALATENQTKCLNDTYCRTETYLGDIDSDGHLELIHGLSAICFDMGGASKEIRFPDAGGVFAGGGLKDIYTTNQGVYYTHYSVSFGEIQTVVNGQTRYYEGASIAYDPLWGTGDELLIFESDRYRLSENYDSQSYEVESTADVFYERSINSEKVTEAEWTSYFEKNNFQKITQRADEFTAYEYEARYHDSVVNALDNLLNDKYEGYRGMYAKDLDGDGLEERLFLVSEHMNPWFQNINISSNPMTSRYPDVGNVAVNETIDMEKERTALIVVQVKGDKMQVKAYSTYGNIAEMSQDNIIYRNSHLILGENQAIYMPNKTAEQTETLTGIEYYLADNGYQDTLMQYAELVETDGEELVCVSKKDEQWNVLIFMFHEGAPILIYKNQLDNEACFLTESEGQPAILLYQQDVAKNSNGIFENIYNYIVYSFEVNGSNREIDRQNFRYDELEQSALQTSEFFAMLNQYITKTDVVYDPFSLNGKMWMDEDDVAYGKLPEEENKEEEKTATEQLGFVEIADTNSWLHLRVGPGMNYDKVLIDPADTDSFIRQADGSPVTILETVKSDDKENPEWVKIRIRYQGKDIIGYSSKRYIRLSQ